MPNVRPSQIAREWCANFDSDGSCLGAKLDDACQIVSCAPLDRCLLLENPVQRCGYFESCVMPMKLDPSDGSTAEQKTRLRLERDQFDAGVRAYLTSTGRKPDQIVASGRLCPLCKTREIEPRHRYCYLCALEREKETARERMRRSRQKGESDVTT